MIKKYEKTLGAIEDKIISMYAKGMTTRDIQSHVEEIYGLDISPTTVSKITDSIVVHAKEWQSRPFAEVPQSIDLRVFSYAIEKQSSPGCEV